MDFMEGLGLQQAL
ncbi:uncharacterized protein FTOL_13456 [Fusarium torulosum]|uniref:Uncharacterized protein n=1 Tax=Fusarium torulosum TaxID=33205 RepID=A0AAE8SPU9_9HYPO|nr:uncharacterized protein FTOL_13456 [Fusarium torulosum]